MNRAVFASLAAASLAWPPRRASAQAGALRVGDLPIEADAQPYYADHLGLFERGGLHVAITSIANGAAILSGVLGGSLDVGVSNIISLASAYKRGIEIACIAGSSVYTHDAPTSGLLVAAASPIRTPRDLNGRTIAVNGLKNITQLAPMAWIDAAGGASETVRFVELSFPEMIPALDQGRVDAVLVAEPALSAGGPAVRVLGYPYDAVAPRFLLGCFFATTSWLEQNRALARRFVAVLREAGAWANTHHAESGDVLAALTKMDSARIARMTRATYPDRLVTAEVQPVIDLAAKYGIIRETFPARELVWNR